MARRSHLVREDDLLPQVDNAPFENPKAEVKLFGRAIKEGWKIPQAARTAGIKLLREVLAGLDKRAAAQAARVLALIDQRELDLQLKAAALDLKREMLDLKREQLGIERESLNRQDDPDIHLTIEFQNELPPQNAPADALAAGGPGGSPPLQAAGDGP